MPSISSSVLVLKRDKCSRSIKWTLRIIVQRDTLKTLAIFTQVKPILLLRFKNLRVPLAECLSMVSLRVLSLPIDRRDKEHWMALLYCFQNLGKISQVIQ